MSAHPSIHKAIEAFDSGRLVALPTETVYGLAAPVNRPALVRKVFAIKQRPLSDPLIVHVADWTMAQSYVNQFPNYVHSLVQTYWPGPLTLLLPKARQVDPIITAQSDWVALRMPNHPWALAIIQAVGCGLVAPSANPFQKVSPTRAQDVRAYFSEEEVTVIDGGPCQVGIESTLIQLFPKKVVVIRKGMVTASMLANTLQDQKVDVLDAQGVQVAPGQDPNHYQPAVPLVLCKQSMSEAEVAQAVGQSLQLFHGQCIHLSDNADTAAREIYQQLRSAKPTTEYLWLDVSNIDAQQEKWQAILDRLHRAASLVIG